MPRAPESPFNLTHGQGWRDSTISASAAIEHDLFALTAVVLGGGAFRFFPDKAAVVLVESCKGPTPGAETPSRGAGCGAPAVLTLEAVIMSMFTTPDALLLSAANAPSRQVRSMKLVSSREKSIHHRPHKLSW